MTTEAQGREDSRWKNERIAELEQLVRRLIIEGMNADYVATDPDGLLRTFYDALDAQEKGERREKELADAINWLNANAPSVVRWAIGERIRGRSERIAELETERRELEAALRNLRLCIMDTRGPNAHDAVAVADDLLAKIDADQQEKGDE